MSDNQAVRKNSTSGNLLKEVENYGKLGFKNVIIIERPEIEMVITVIYSGGEVLFAPFQTVKRRPLEFGAKRLPSETPLI